MLLMAFCLLGEAQQYVPIGGIVDSVLVLPKLGGDSAYLVEDFLSVTDKGTLVVKPGSKLYFSQSACLRVEGGSMILDGQPNDSIYLLCYEFSHDWTGIQLKNITTNDSVSMSYAVVMGFLTAFDASSATGVRIRHSTFNNYYAGKGMSLVDCNDFVIDSCFFFRCNSGIELKAKTRDCKNNVISHCIFDQGQINVEVSNVGYGYKCHNNQISDNCFQGAATAISFESVGGVSDKEAVNYILNNVITTSLPEGSGHYSSHGIKAAMDTLVIRNNVFWANDEAVRMLRVCHMDFKYNTFYDNGLVLTNLLRSGSANLSKNTFSEAENRIAAWPSGSYKLNNNNILHHKEGVVLFTNNSAETVNMKRNCWDMSSTDEIEDLLHHHSDNPELGEILFEPFLAECDTLAPISPPFRVKKQFVKGSWLISWDENPERDIDHYVLFYGNFNYYKFAHHIDSIFGNSFLLSSQQSDNVAIMACDGAYNPDIYASVGQSAYAFASYYPYAGEDADLCAPATGFEIQDASIPYTYNRFIWRSSGSGVFADSLALRTIYYPSDADFETGEVTLTIHVYGDGAVKTDAMQLKLFKELGVFAGDDYYSGLNRPILLDKAEAFNCDSLRWSSIGDGFFEDPTILNSVYHLGNQDINQKSVLLILEAWSFCDHVRDTIRFDLFEDFSLEGTVWAGGQQFTEAQVIAASLNDVNPFVSGFYRTVSDAEGRFRFASLLPDTYILYAMPDTMVTTIGGAYYLGDFQWNESNMIIVDGNVYDVDVVMPDVMQGFFGEGKIGGFFDYPETTFKARDFYCRPWLHDGDSVAYCTTGLSNVGVLLLNETKQKLMGFALTDADGAFRFRNLPFGTYYVLADLPRYGRGTCEQVTISPSQPELAGLHLYVNHEGKVAMRAMGEGENERKWSVFPNPATNRLSIVGMKPDGNYVIRVTDALGNKVMRDIQAKSDLLGECAFSVEGLSRGVYFVLVSNLTEIQAIKFIKY